MNKEIYFDNAATTQVDNEVISIITEGLKNFYNPSSVYFKGKDNFELIQKAKQDIAKSINATSPKQIFFTSGGTEGNNWAIRGFVDSFLYSKPILNFKPHIITSAIEHHSILNVCEFLESTGLVEVTYVKPNSDGSITVDLVKQYVKESTILISIMAVNNVLGKINDIYRIGKLCKELSILFHTDTVQALGKINIDVQRNNIDMLTCSGHKIHAPKGVGFVYIENPEKIKSLFYGGLQEYGLRAGTENLPYIQALKYCVNKYLNPKRILDNSKKISTITQYLLQQLNKGFTDKIIVSGDIGTINIAFKNISSDILVWELGLKNIFVSIGSACDNGLLEENYVLKSIDIPHDYINGNIRITYNEFNTLEECEKFIDILQEIILKLRGYL